MLLQSKLIKSSISKRFKNGRKIPNNHVKYFEYPIAKIETIDPDDEGFYQCLAKNDFGEVSANFYLHIRYSELLDRPPQHAKCFPMDKGFIFVTYDKEIATNMIQYYIASDNPRDFFSHISEAGKSKSFKIDTVSTSIFKPLKPFYLYMRNLQQVSKNMAVSELSKPIRCASQGIEPKFVKPLTGLFLYWSAPFTDTNITSYTLQFEKNDALNPVYLKDEVIGTYELFQEFVSWEEVEDKRQKISAKNKNQTNWTEVTLPGNVTGLYIPNIEEVNVRILGTVLESGEIFEQDLKYLSWNNIKASTFVKVRLSLNEFDAHTADIEWTGLDSLKCIPSVCVIMKGIPIVNRGGLNFKCEQM